MSSHFHAPTALAPVETGWSPGTGTLKIIQIIQNINRMVMNWKDVEGNSELGDFQRIAMTLWVVPPCRLTGRYQHFGKQIMSPEDTDTICLEHVVVYVPLFTVSKPRTSIIVNLTTWEPQISWSSVSRWMQVAQERTMMPAVMRTGFCYPALVFQKEVNWRMEKDVGVLNHRDRGNWTWWLVVRFSGGWLRSVTLLMMTRGHIGGTRTVSEINNTN